MNRLVLLLALLLCMPIAARADDASHRAKAQELIMLLHADQLPIQLKDNIMKDVETMGNRDIGPDPTPEQKARLADLQTKVATLVDTQLSWKSLEPDYADLYVKAFTEDELDGIIAFYKSPAGIALLANVPAVSKESVNLLRTRMIALQPQIKQLITDFQSESAHPAPSSPTKPETTPKTAPQTTPKTATGATSPK